MKKQYKMRIVCVVIIAVLLGGVMAYAVREQKEDYAYNEERSEDISENTETEEDVKKDNVESEIFPEETEPEESVKPGNIKTVISPNELLWISELDDNGTERGKWEYVSQFGIIALDDNGNVWKWEEGQTIEDAVKIAGVENVIQIVDTGCCSVYALTSEGDVYAWGLNYGWLIDSEINDTNVEFSEPVKLQGLSDIISIDAANGRAFAVNDDGQLLVWGLGRYKFEMEDYVPTFLEEYRELTGNVEEIYVGAGDFHYFKCEDNQIFSIISIDQMTDYFSDFLIHLIVPNFPGEPSASAWHNEIYEGNSERIFDLREESGFYFVYLYKMGENANVALMGADAYTMYLYQDDGTLWYWNSDRITYHDDERVGATIEPCDLDYSGFFEEVDIGAVLNTEGDSTEIPAIISISPGKEGALFLLEDGQVLVSEYVTAEIKDVEYFGRNHSDPRITWTSVEHNFTTKELSFRRLDFENIVNISSDKNNHFYLVDELGNIYFYQIEAE